MTSKLSRIGLGLLVAQGTLLAPPAWSGATTTSSSSSSTTSSACNNNTTGGTQGNRQCQAGAAMDDASNKNTVAGMVYTGAAAACAYACYSSYYTGGAGEAYCTYSTLGAGVTEGVLSQNMASAAGALSGPAMQTLFKDGATSGAAAGKAAGGNTGNHMSCVTTALDSLQAATQFANSGTNAAAAQQAYKNAASLINTSDPSYNPSSNNNYGSGAASAGGSGVGGITGTGGGDACATGARTGSASAVMQCAASLGDPRLKAIVSNPNFLSDLQKVAGMAPSDFFNKARDEGSGKAVAGALSGTANSDFMGKLGNVLVAAQRDATSHAANAGYTSSGGARGVASAKGKDINDTLAELMAKLQQKPEEEKKDENNLAFAFKGERYPANVAENRNVSLFERVTFRYYRAAPRLIEAPPTRSN